MMYTEGFRSRMVKRMSGVERISACALCKETGVSQGTLSRWLRNARTLTGMGNGKHNKQGAAKSSPRWTVAEKLRMVVESAALSDEDLGAFLRREGLHQAQLDQWREAALDALADGEGNRRKKPSREAKRIKELEKELRRKEKALAETAALLVLKKKAQQIWGDEDDPTRTKNGI